MTKLRYFLATVAFIGIGSAYAQTKLGYYQPGPRLIDGTQLNLMVDVVNTLSGNGVSALTVNSIAGGDASLGITGLSADQGGAIAIVGGTSTSTANAGGAITGVGGTPGATGVGGAVSWTAGKGGATSGNGGVASLTGGAGTAGNGVGGVSRVVAGAGNGSGAGGAAQVTGGAAGATGTGGAVTIAGGAAAAGVGGAVTISAGASAGGTNGGGVVNLVPGAAVSTGAPGTVQVNGNANLMCASYVMNTTPAATDAVFYVATRPLMLVTVSQVHSVAAGGTSTLQVTKDSTTAAPGAGTDMLTAAFNLNATANTVQVGSITTVVADKTFAAGDRLAVDYADAVQSSVGVVITACFAPL